MMKLALIFICVFLPIALSAQTLLREKVLVSSSESQPYPGELSPELSYISNGKDLFQLTVSGMDLLQHEEYFVWSIDHYVSRGRLLYTYGPAATIYPAILDLRTKAKEIIGKEIVKAKAGLPIVSFGECFWLDDETVVSFVLLKNGEKAIITYNILSKSISVLAKNKEIDMLRVNRGERVITYRKVVNNITQYRIFKLDTSNDSLLTESRYSELIPMVGGYFLCISTNGVESFVEFLNGNGKVVTKEVTDISGVVYYDEEANIVVALLNRDDNSREFRFGVFHVKSNGP